MSKRRFEYVRMTGNEFQDALDSADVKLATFSRMTGMPLPRLTKWADGSEDIPYWVPVYCAALKVSGALVAMKDEAAKRVKLDTWNEDRGEFPYLNGGDDDND